jgi:hypothetical protein
MRPAVPSIAQARQIRDAAPQSFAGGSSAGPLHGELARWLSRIRRRDAIGQREVHHQVGARQEGLVHRGDELVVVTNSTDGSFFAISSMPRQHGIGGAMHVHRVGLE